MNRVSRRLSVSVVGVLALVSLAACVAGGYDGGDVSVGYYGGFYDPYYEPFGYEYGGWGPGYRVGPPRFRGGGGRGGGPPSIPRGPRGGGGHGGGGRH